MKTPGPWTSQIETTEVDVLPLVTGSRPDAYPGWTSYVEPFEGAPEVEVFCGGINSKLPSAAALWRQGNLLHFGFEEAPDELNEIGRDLLENAIHYIARFTHDRPIAYAPSVFVTRRSVPLREHVLARLRSTYPEERLLEAFYQHERERYSKMGREAYAEHFAAQLGMYAPNEAMELTLDPDLEAWGLDDRTPAFVERCLRGLAAGGEEAARARRLLTRFVPCGPEADAPVDRWETWWRENRPYLFFSESGGHRWYLDPLARERGVPSSELTGALRADVTGD